MLISRSWRSEPLITYVIPYIFFSSFHQIKPVPILLPTGVRVLAHYSGTIHFSDFLYLTDVLFILEFCFNLISISKLTKGLTRQLIFTEHAFFFFFFFFRIPRT